MGEQSVMNSVSAEGKLQAAAEFKAAMDRPTVEATTARSAAETSEPLTLSSIKHRSAGSMNTAADFAGLKPWSRDWVFEGNLNRGPQAKSLFGETLAAPVAAQAASVAGAKAQALEPTRGESPISAEQMQTLEKMVREMGMSPREAATLMVAANEASAQALGAPKAQLLSGGEYLGALQAVRSAPEGVSAHQQRSMGQNGQGSEGQGGEGKFRLIEGGAQSLKGGKRNSLEGLGFESQVPVGAHALHAAPLRDSQPLKSVELTGQVVQGAMTRDRLSTDAMFGLSGAVRDLSRGGGGEIRLRLNPNNLGELTLRVSTQGQHVGLHIQASDPKSKQVLEESLNSLKESLAQHQLTLGAVEMSVAQSRGSQEFSSSQQQQQGQGNFGQGQLQDWNLQPGLQQNHQQESAWNQGEGRNSSRERDVSQVSSVSAPMAARGMGAARSATAAGSGRLDVLA